MADRYDVIFLGINVDSAERDAAITNIAAVLEMNEEEIKYLVDNKISASVKEGVSMEMARKYQKDILRVGGISNYRPSLTSRKLELAPIEPDRDSFLFLCPACEFKQEVSSEKELPLQCPQCGVIPSKYDKMAAIKAEREKIKQRLLNAHRIREQQDQELADKLEAEKRQRLLEEEIRKELGLPKLINTRFRLFGSAAFIWILGMGMGGAGVGLFYKSMEKDAFNQASAGNQAGNLQDAFELPENDLGIPPQQDTMKQVFSLSRKLNNIQGSETPASGKPATTGQKGQAEDGSTGSVAEGAGKASGNPKVKHLDVKFVLQELGQDGEWDLFLASQSQKLLDSQQTVKAYHVANAIVSSRLKVKALGHLAEYFRKINNIADGENIFNLMAVYINNLPDIKERIEAYGILALSLGRMGDGEKANQNLETAEKLALTLNNPVDNARSLARVASYQAQIGKQAEADANFRRVNTMIHSMTDKATLLSAYIKLATSYAESGSRGIALAILNETLLATKQQIKNEIERDRLFGEIAEAYVKLGDADSALLAAGKLGPEMKDKALYTVVCELAYADRLYDAMKILDKIDPPEYKARAAALISRLQRAHPDMGTLSTATQEKALAAQALIPNLQDQSIVRGEFARYLAHAGQTQPAEEWARKAMTSAQGIESPQERDDVYAVLSGNLARANQAKLAEDTKKLILAPSLSEIVDRENVKIARLFSGM